MSAYKVKSPIPITEGGTGIQTATVHGVVVGNTTSAFNVTTAGTDGQVLLGSSAADPVFATLTSSDSSITFTPGAGTLSLQAVSSAPTPHNFQAYLANNLTGVVGNTNNFKVIFDTVLYDTDTAYNNTTGTYTIPSAGIWLFGATISLGGGPWTGASYVNVFFEGSFSLVPASGFIQCLLVPISAESALGSLFPTYTVNTTNQFAAGDSITVRVGCSGAGANTIDIEGNAAEFFTQFWGCKLA